MDTLGNLLALHATAANEQEHGQVAELARQVQEVTGQRVEIAYVDQGYTGESAAQQAAAHNIKLEVVEQTEAKRGFVLLPRRWVVKRTLAGSAASVAWLETTNDLPTYSFTCTGLPSLECFSSDWLGKIHNRPANLRAQVFGLLQQYLSAALDLADLLAA